MAIVFEDSLSSAKEYSIKFKNFKGVDYANTKLNVSAQRATESRNMIHDDSVNRKRNGWIQRAFIHDSKGTPLRINGFWEMKDKNGIIHSIVHAGNKIFRIFFGEDVLENTILDISSSNTYYPSFSNLTTWTSKIINGIKDVKSYGIVRGNRLYIFAGGAYLVYGTWGEKICDICNGNGVLTNCDTCNGTKRVICPTCNPNGINTTGKIDCPVCGGDGKINCQNHHTTTEGACTVCEKGKITCLTCSGTGTCQDCLNDEKCNTCGGVGKLYCDICGNTGRVYPCYECGSETVEDADPNCQVCGGTGGEVDCPNCYGGTEGYVCPECGGGTCLSCKGEKKCSDCDGTGKITCTTCNGNYSGKTSSCTTCNTTHGINVSKCTNECENGKVMCTQEGCENGLIYCPDCKNLQSTEICETCKGKGTVISSDSVFELRLVQDNSDTYIPTTTIGITPIGSDIGGNRVSLEEANILARRRKNKLVWSRATSEVNVMTSDYFSQSIFEASNDWNTLKNKYCYQGNLSSKTLEYIRISFTLKDVQYEATIDYESNKLSTGWVMISSAAKLNAFIEELDLDLLNQVNIKMRCHKGNISFCVALGSNETLSIDEIYISIEKRSYQLDCIRIDSAFPITVKSNGYLITEDNYILDYNTGILNFTNDTIFEDSIYTPKVEGES